VSAELWSAIFSGATFVVIAVTAIAAVVQLRHLRASNQLDALLTLMELWNQPSLQDHFAYVRGKLQDELKDPSFLRELNAELEKGPLSRSEHVEFAVADFWEQIGAFLKYDLIDERSWLDVASPQAARSWDLLLPVVEAIRQRFGPVAYENFEYAAVRARLWLDKHPDGTYPRTTPRMAELKAARASGQGAR
jgi:hypothetical protein